MRLRLALTLALAVLLSGSAWELTAESLPSGDASRPLTNYSPASADWRERTRASPRRVQVLDAAGVVATFTVGARTVTLRGRSRELVEPSTTTASITGTTRVRLLDAPFNGRVNYTWLRAALADTSPDLLAVALEYVAGSAAVIDRLGGKISGDASYGPLQADGTRAEGADFNDYLGMPWQYGSSTDEPETAQFGSLDCSGFVRMVFGYRSAVPLSIQPDGSTLPRRAVEMLSSAPGVVTVTDTGSVPPSVARLSPGDLVFFDADSDDGAAVDHVGIFLGRDASGAPRFISSRKTVDGPTMGDVGGRSLLSGTGLYATSWRAARRL